MALIRSTIQCHGMITTLSCKNTITGPVLYTQLMLGLANVSQFYDMTCAWHPFEWWSFVDMRGAWQQKYTRDATQSLVENNRLLVILFNYSFDYFVHETEPVDSTRWQSINRNGVFHLPVTAVILAQFSSIRQLCVFKKNFIYSIESRFLCMNYRTLEGAVSWLS